MGEMPQWDDSGPEPIYRQVADYVAAQIADGTLVRGAKLPAERDLASQWGVAYLTIRRAMRELRERGLIVTTQGRGTYVAK
jgi:GntR family transcriptional regulator